MKGGMPVAVDLFSGAGGLTEGLKNAGFYVFAAAEIDPASRKTYCINHPEVKLVKSKNDSYDIREINGSDILEGTGIKKNAVDLVAGGPPCQGFSISNKKTRNGKNPANHLIYEFLRIVMEIRPKWMLLENVPGIRSFKKGKVVDEIIQYCEANDYKVETTLLNAVNFGVPQNRHRFFSIATRTKKSLSFVESLEKMEVVNPLTVLDATSDLPKLKNGHRTDEMPYITEPQNEYQKAARTKMNGRVTGNIVSKNSALVVERYCVIKQGENWKAVMKRKPELMQNYKDASRCHSGIYKRLHEGKPSVVISNYRKNMLIHPTENRGLSVREASRIQSFPDQYSFENPISTQQQQVANAVPPLLAKAVCEKIIEQLK